MIGDYKPKQTDVSAIRCKCNKSHERIGLVSLHTYRYRGYKGTTRFFHKEIVLPIENVTHFVLGTNAIVGLNLSDSFRIISKHKFEFKRVLFVSNTTDAEFILVCKDFWREIYE